MEDELGLDEMAQSFLEEVSEIANMRAVSTVKRPCCRGPKLGRLRNSPREDALEAK